MPLRSLFAFPAGSVTLDKMALTKENAILFNVKDQEIAVMQINRPQARNALNWFAQERFAELVKAVMQDSAIRVLIVTGTGRRAFVSGGDLKELAQHPERAAGEKLNRIMTAALSDLTRLPIPVIAAINGDAFGGGCEIITACDLRIASARARFSFAHVKNGLTTGWGGGIRLIHQIGQSRALELLLTARQFDAQEARQFGFVHRIVPEQEDVLEGAIQWAAGLCTLPRDALAQTKALAHASFTLPISELEQDASARFIDLWETADHLEALAAFQQKRPPLFNQDRPPDIHS